MRRRCGPFALSEPVDDVVEGGGRPRNSLSNFKHGGGRRSVGVVVDVVRVLPTGIGLLVGIRNTLVREAETPLGAALSAVLALRNWKKRFQHFS